MFIYITKKNNKFIAGIVHASNSFEALHNARLEAFMRGASVKNIITTNL